jgi:hypothetical protein
MGVQFSRADATTMQRPGTSTSHQAADLREHKPEILRELACTNTVNGIHIAELRALAGADWPELERDPALLATFAHAVEIRKMRERGEIPPHYTKSVTCERCGPVMLWEGAPNTVVGCPWCLNRAAGKPAPPRTA